MNQKILKIITLSITLMSSSPGYAITKGSGGGGLSKSSPAMSVIEWNPADLNENKIRANMEYIVIDGFAFGVSAEFQKRDEEKWRQSIGALGISATQYFQSQTLSGPFIKGETSVFGTEYEQILPEKDGGSLFGLGLEANLGYRFDITERFSGAAGYGVRRNLPGFFSADYASVSEVYRNNTRQWEPRINLSLGMLL